LVQLTVDTDLVRGIYATSPMPVGLMENIYILEPVSVGGWNKIRLRRITRSSTCVCLRIRNYFVLFCAMRDMRAAHAPHSNFALAAVAAPCSIPELTCFALVFALRARAGRLRRPDCALRALRARRPHNLCPLAQWVFVPIWGSIGPARWTPMRYVWCCAHVCARSAHINEHAHQCALATADPNNFCPLFQ
jgi:hypothetical protein